MKYEMTENEQKETILNNESDHGTAATEITICIIYVKMHFCNRARKDLFDDFFKLISQPFVWLN